MSLFSFSLNLFKVSSGSSNVAEQSINHIYAGVLRFVTVNGDVYLSCYQATLAHAFCAHPEYI